MDFQLSFHFFGGRLWCFLNLFFCHSLFVFPALLLCSALLIAFLHPRFSCNSSLAVLAYVRTSRIIIFTVHSHLWLSVSCQLIHYRQPDVTVALLTWPLSFFVGLWWLHPYDSLAMDILFVFSMDMLICTWVALVASRLRFLQILPNRQHSIPCWYNHYFIPYPRFTVATYSKIFLIRSNKTIRLSPCLIPLDIGMLFV